MALSDMAVSVQKGTIISIAPNNITGWTCVSSGTKLEGN